MISNWKLAYGDWLSQVRSIRGFHIGESWSPVQVHGMGCPVEPPDGSEIRTDHITCTNGQNDSLIATKRSSHSPMHPSVYSFLSYQSHEPYEVDCLQLLCQAVVTEGYLK